MHFVILQDFIGYLGRTHFQANGGFVHEARPPLLDEPFGSFGVRGFIQIALLVYDADVFCDGYHPLIQFFAAQTAVHTNALFYPMGAVPAVCCQNVTQLSSTRKLYVLNKHRAGFLRTLKV